MFGVFTTRARLLAPKVQEVVSEIKRKYSSHYNEAMFIDDEEEALKRRRLKKVKVSPTLLVKLLFSATE